VIQPNLRPLGAGEVLDGAVTLFVRRFLPLVLTLAIGFIPITILSDLLHPPDAVKTFNDIFHPAAVAPGHETQVLLATFKELFNPKAVLEFILANIVAVFVSNACTTVAAGAYRGETIAVAQALRASLARVIPQLAGMIVFAVLYLGLVLVTAIFAILLAVPVAVLSLFLKSTAFLIGALGVVVIGPHVAVAAMLLLAWQLAFVTIAVEEAHPIRAIRKSLRRTFSKAAFMRSLLVAAVLAAVYIGGSLLLTAVEAVTASLTHGNALTAVIDSIMELLSGALLTCYYVVYWYNVRVRREGYDLALAVEAAN
jgi:hypothetical protein